MDDTCLCRCFVIPVSAPRIPPPLLLEEPSSIQFSPPPLPPHMQVSWARLEVEVDSHKAISPAAGEAANR
jgi:hypothetical protein